MRKTLYTDASLDPFLGRVKADGKLEFPLSTFFEANHALKSGDKTKAIAQLKQIVETQGLETRVYLQAWHTLTSLGELPPESFPSMRTCLGFPADRRRTALNKRIENLLMVDLRGQLEVSRA